MLYGTRLPYLLTDEDRKDFNIGGAALTNDEMQTFFAMVRAGEYWFHIPPFTLMQAIDGNTGDSFLHMVVRAGSMDGVINLMERFDCARTSRSLRAKFFRWAAHAFISHQNNHGNTVFHLAARNGNLKLLIMLYRYINFHWSAPYPDEDDEDPPEDEVYPSTASEESSSPHLMLLLTKNSAGLDAAAEARLAGNEEIAEWIEMVIDRLDPKGTRRSDEGKAKMLKMVKDTYCYEFMRERQRRALSSSL